MSKKYLVTVTCLLGLLVGISIVLNRQSTAQSRRSSPPSEVQAEVPEHVLYRHLFHHVIALKKKSEDAERDGKDASQFRTHFKRQAGLNDSEVTLLNDIARQYDEQEKALDARARPIIDAYRAQYPGGQVPHGQTPAPPPPELRSLSQQRDALALQSKDQLRSAFGTDFARFDKFVKTRVAADTNLQSPR